MHSREFLQPVTTGAQALVERCHVVPEHGVSRILNDMDLRTRRQRDAQGHQAAHTI